MEWLFVILMTTIALYRNLKVRDIHMMIRYNKLRKFRNRRIENSPQNKGQGQRHLVE